MVNSLKDSQPLADRPRVSLRLCSSALGFTGSPRSEESAPHVTRMRTRIQVVRRFRGGDCRSRVYGLEWFGVMVEVLGFRALWFRNLGMNLGLEAREFSLKVSLHRLTRTATERRGNTLKGFKDTYLKAKARIWP